MFGHNAWGTFEASVVNKFSAEEITPISNSSWSSCANSEIYYSAKRNDAPIQLTYKPDFSENTYEIPIWSGTKKLIPATHQDYDKGKWQGKWFGWDWDSDNDKVYGVNCGAPNDKQYGKWATPVADVYDTSGQTYNHGWGGASGNFRIHERVVRPWLNLEIVQIKYEEILNDHDNMCRVRELECDWNVIIETKLFELTSEGPKELFWTTTLPGGGQDKYHKGLGLPFVVNDLDGDGTMITPYGEWETHTLDDALEFGENLVKERNAQKQEEIKEEEESDEPDHEYIEPPVIDDEEEPETPVEEEEEEPPIIHKPPPCGTPAGGPCAEPSKLPFILGIIGLAGVVTYIGTKGD